jgi:hypothetical protein
MCACVHAVCVYVRTHVYVDVCVCVRMCVCVLELCIFSRCFHLRTGDGKGERILDDTCTAGKQLIMQMRDKVNGETKLNCQSYLPCALSFNSFAMELDLYPSLALRHCASRSRKPTRSVVICKSLNIHLKYFNSFIYLFSASRSVRRCSAPVKCPAWHKLSGCEIWGQRAARACLGRSSCSNFRAQESSVWFPPRSLLNRHGPAAEAIRCLFQVTCHRPTHPHSRCSSSSSSSSSS